MVFHRGDQSLLLVVPVDIVEGQIILKPIAGRKKENACAVEALNIGLLTVQLACASGEGLRHQPRLTLSNQPRPTLDSRKEKGLERKYRLEYIPWSIIRSLTRLRT